MAMTDNDIQAIRVEINNLKALLMNIDDNMNLSHKYSAFLASTIKNLEEAIK